MYNVNSLNLGHHILIMNRLEVRHFFSIGEFKSKLNRYSIDKLVLGSMIAILYFDLSGFLFGGEKCLSKIIFSTDI